MGSTAGSSCRRRARRSRTPVVRVATEGCERACLSGLATRSNRVAVVVDDVERLVADAAVPEDPDSGVVGYGLAAVADLHRVALARAEEARHPAAGVAPEL